MLPIDLNAWVEANRERLRPPEGEAGEQELPALSRRPQWLSDEQLVDVTEAGLVRVDIDGELTVLDAAATGLVRL